MLSKFILNNTRKSALDIVYILRVPKTGSTSKQTFIRRILRKKNKFKIGQKIPRKYITMQANLSEQALNVKEVIHHEKNTVFFGMHENFIEFTIFGKQKPIYISLIRDPIEKAISWFYYIRSGLFPAHLKATKKIMKKIGEWKWRNQSFEDCVMKNKPECSYIQNSLYHHNDYRRQSLQFCGNYEYCLEFGSSTAIQKAKHNVEQYFAVVGSFEDTNVTLTVLEHYIPKYFKGALHLFNENYERFYVNKNIGKQPTNEKIKEIVRKNFTGEIDFYKFCKQRLYRQYLALKLNGEDNKSII